MSHILSSVLTTDGTAVPVRFQAVGSAPILSQKVFKVSASQKFETVVNFLRKKLQCKPTDSVFLYVNSIFAPGLDEGVGNLYRVSS
jgi:ubiquitin-like protein ATG12